MAGITSIGVGSGIDLESLIENLLAAEATPTTLRLNSKEATIGAQISAFGTTKSVLAQFQSSLSALSDIDALQRRAATSSDTSLFTATADNSAVEGSYAVQVLNLAKAQKLASPDFADPNATVGSGTLTISASGDNFVVNVQAGDTLAELVQAINEATGNDSVSATLLTVDNGLGDNGTVTKLVLSALQTGEANTITVTVVDDDGNNLDDAGLSRFSYDASGAVVGGVERLAPDGNVFTTSGFSGTPSVTDIVDDPDAADANFLIANNRNTNTSVRVSFPTPSGNLATGADLQEIRVAARETAGSGTGTPTIDIEIYEAGNPTPLFTSAAQNVVGTGTQVFSFTFDASILANITGTDIEVVVNGNRSGGPGPQQSAVDVGAVEFNADVQPPPALGQLQEIESALDARIAVDGFTAISSSNVFTDVISGVTITAQREPENPSNPETETLTIAQNTAAVQASVQGFVESYNEVVTTLKDLTSYNADTGVAGPLNGDATIRSLLSQFRSILGDKVDDATDIQHLAELGFRTDRDGSVSIDASILSAAIDENFEDIGILFASENGIAKRLDTLLDSYLKFDGILSTRTDGFDQQLGRINEQREDLDRRLIKIEEQFRSRFAALDALIARLQSTNDFLAAQLENTASIIGRSPGGGSN